jgi:hypothetical protein
MDELKIDPLETLQKVSNVITQKPVEITVEVDPQSWLHGKLQKLLPKFYPKEKVLTLRPVKMGTLLRMSELLLPIEKEIYSHGNLIDANLQAIQKHSKTLCRVIALAIHNKKTEPPESLVNMISEQFTPQSIMGVLVEVLKAMDVKSFMSSIIFIRGLNLLEMNPQTRGSQIAPGTSSEE